MMALGTVTFLVLAAWKVDQSWYRSGFNTKLGKVASSSDFSDAIENVSLDRDGAGFLLSSSDFAEVFEWKSYQRASIFSMHSLICVGY